MAIIKTDDYVPVNQKEKYYLTSSYSYNYNTHVWTRKPVQNKKKLMSRTLPVLPEL